VVASLCSIKKEHQRQSHGIPLTGQCISLERGFTALQRRGSKVDAAAPV